VTDDAQSRFEQFTDALAGGDLDVLPSFLADSFFSYEPGPDEPTAAARFAVIVSNLKEAMPDLTVSIGEASGAISHILDDMAQVGL
jgi:hypothetical protein